MEKSYIVMGTLCLVVIFLGILIYFLDKQNEKKIKQTEKEDSRKRSRKELLVKFRLHKKKLKNKELKQK